MGKEKLLPQMPESGEGEWHWKAKRRTEAFWCEVPFGSCESATLIVQVPTSAKGADSVSSRKPSEAYFPYQRQLALRTQEREAVLTEAVFKQH